MLDDSGQLSLFSTRSSSASRTPRGSPVLRWVKSGAYSIAMDRAGTLAVAYSSGELFTADVQTGACKASALVVPQKSPRRFDMSFVSDDSSATGEQLYVVTLEDDSKARLGKLDPGR